MRARLLSWQDQTGWCGDGADGSDAQAVLYFGARDSLTSGKCYGDLRAAFAHAHLLGCSTGGQILGDEVVDDEVAAVALSFDATEVRLASAEAESSHAATANRSCQAGIDLGKKLSAPDLAGIFILSDGLHVNGSALVDGIGSVVGPSVPLIGGLAGDGERFERTLVGADGAPRERLIAALGFYGPAIHIGYGSAGGWDRFGPRRRVTRSDGNVLYTLDDEPALDLYERYLGDEAEGLPGTALYFPLRVFEPGHPERDMVRTVLSVDRAARTMTFAGDVPQGWVTQLMRGNFDRLAEGAGEAGRLAHNGASAWPGDKLAILVSCIGRRMLMGQNTLDEVEAAGTGLADVDKRIGFYSYGEISPHRASGCAQLHNQTMTIATLCEAAEGPRA